MKTTTLLSACLLALSVGVASAENRTETLSNGVKIEHLKEGSGASPTASDTVVAHYRGTLPDACDPKQCSSNRSAHFRQHQHQHQCASIKLLQRDHRVCR